jgi:hypothetical protein
VLEQELLVERAKQLGPSGLHGQALRRRDEDANVGKAIWLIRLGGRRHNHSHILSHLSSSLSKRDQTVLASVLFARR